MNKNRKIMMALMFTAAVCFSLAGCSLQDKIEEYSSNKEQCYLTMENVTQFSYKGNNYTILEDTVSNGGLGVGISGSLPPWTKQEKYYFKRTWNPRPFRHWQI